MSLGNAWENIFGGSVAKLNLSTITFGTGAYLAGLDKTKHKILVCTATGSGFTIDHAYLCKADGSGVIDLSNLVAHTHTNSNNGGSLTSILYSSPEIIDLLLVKTSDLKKAQWLEQVTGTGTIEDFQDGTTDERAIRMRPNGTSGSGSSVGYPIMSLLFSSPSTFITKLLIETASSLALHTGVNADLITAADSNTIKYNAEICTATNNNWFLRSANGSANSTSDTGTAMTTSRVGIRLIHRPDLGTPEVNMEIDSGTTFQKTTHIPLTGSSARKNGILHSMKNNTAADRPLKMFGCRLVYETGDSWGYGLS